MIGGLRHEYTPEWRARWDHITKALHYLSLALVVGATGIGLQGHGTLALSAFAASFLVRALWERAHDHLDARTEAFLSELKALRAELEAGLAQRHELCALPDPAGSRQYCCRERGHDGPHVMGGPP